MARFPVGISGLQGFADRSCKFVATAATQTMAEVDRGLTRDLRAMTATALGTRVGNTWRGRHFPESAVSIDAAVSVKTKAPSIIDAFERGALIVPSAGKQYLAIPSPNVPRTASGRKMRPAEVEAYFGRKLRFARNAKGHLIGLIEVQGLRMSTARAPVRARGHRGPAASVLMFTFVRESKMPKRIDYMRLGDDWALKAASMFQDRLYR